MLERENQHQLNRALLVEASNTVANVGSIVELLSQGADPKARDAMGFDALMRVCARGGKDPKANLLARTLIPVSDLSAVDTRGWCASAIAARAGTVGALSALVEAEAPMSLDNEGVHPAEHARQESIRALMEAAELRVLTKDARARNKSSRTKRM